MPIVQQLYYTMGGGQLKEDDSPMGALQREHGERSAGSSKM